MIHRLWRSLAAGAAALTLAGLMPLVAHAQSAHFTVSLTGGLAGDPDGRGQVTLELKLDEGIACYQLTIQGTGPVSNLRIYELASLRSVALLLNGVGTTSNCVPVEEALLRQIEVNPAAYGVVVGTSQYPASALSGPLIPAEGEPPAAPPEGVTLRDLINRLVDEGLLDPALLNARVLDTKVLDQPLSGLLAADQRLGDYIDDSSPLQNWTLGDLRNSGLVVGSLIGDALNDDTRLSDLPMNTVLAFVLQSAGSQEMRGKDRKLVQEFLAGLTSGDFSLLDDPDALRRLLPFLDDLPGSRDGNQGNNQGNNNDDQGRGNNGNGGGNGRGNDGDDDD